MISKASLCGYDTCQSGLTLVKVGQHLSKWVGGGGVLCQLIGVLSMVYRLQRLFNLHPSDLPELVIEMYEKGR